MLLIPPTCENDMIVGSALQIRHLCSDEFVGKKTVTPVKRFLIL